MSDLGTPEGQTPQPASAPDITAAAPQPEVPTPIDQAEDAVEHALPAPDQDIPADPIAEQAFERAVQPATGEELHQAIKVAGEEIHEPFDAEAIGILLQDPEGRQLLSTMRLEVAELLETRPKFDAIVAEYRGIQDRLENLVDKLDAVVAKTTPDEEVGDDGTLQPASIIKRGDIPGVESVVEPTVEPTVADLAPEQPAPDTLLRQPVTPTAETPHYATAVDQAVAYAEAQPPTPRPAVGEVLEPTAPPAEGFISQVPGAVDGVTPPVAPAPVEGAPQDQGNV